MNLTSEIKRCPHLISGKSPDYCIAFKDYLSSSGLKDNEACTLEERARIDEKDQKRVCLTEKYPECLFYREAKSKITL